MYNDIIESKFTLVMIVVLTALMSFRTTRIYEDILKSKISTPTILIMDGAMAIALIALAAMFVPDVREKMRSDFKRIPLKSVLSLGFYAVLGLGLALVANDVLVHHGTNEVKMYELVVGILVTGVIYFLTSDKKVTPKKIILFILLAIFATLFMNE